MKFIIERERLLKPLQKVTNLLVGRPTLPILGHIMLHVKENMLLLTGTDLDIEIVVRLMLTDFHQFGSITVPARKFFDICRCLPEKSNISVTMEGERILIVSDRSRYFLSTLPASDFPNLDIWHSEIEFNLSRSLLKRLIESTQFSMAHQDVRYYLNGMLFETEGEELRTVATDGHRLAVCAIPISNIVPSHSVIVPRKGVMELTRILDSRENIVKLQIGSNNIRAIIGDYIFTSKLIDGSFPDYRRMLKKKHNSILEANCDILKQAFTRAAILSNEKLRGVRLFLSTNKLKITANNLNNEEAEEIIDVIYQGNEIEICFNVNYIIDVLNILKCEKVKLLVTDVFSNLQIENSISKLAIYVIMPKRL